MSAATFEDHPTDPNKVILRKKPHLDKGRDYEEGFVDGMQYQMHSSVDRAVNAMSKRPWAGLIRGVRVEGETVVISVKGGNDAARELCGALIEEMNK